MSWPFADLNLFLLIAVRIIAMIEVAPLLSGQGVPQVAKLGLAGFAAAMVFPEVKAAGYAVPADGMAYGLLVVGEALIGLVMGFFLSIVYSAFTTAGQFFSLQIGFGASETFDPLAEVELPLMGQFLNLIAMFIFVSTSGFQRLFLIGVQGSFKAMRAIDLVNRRDDIIQFLVRATGALFQQALILSMPVLGTLFIVSVAMGLLSKGRAADEPPHRGLPHLAHGDFLHPAFGPTVHDGGLFPPRRRELRRPGDTRRGRAVSHGERQPLETRKSTEITEGRSHIGNHGNSEFLLPLSIIFSVISHFPPCLRGSPSAPRYRGLLGPGDIDLQWFAAEDEGRTEEPSETKLRKAREEGRVAKSQELIGCGRPPLPGDGPRPPRAIFCEDDARDAALLHGACRQDRHRDRAWTRRRRLLRLFRAAYPALGGSGRRRRDILERPPGRPRILGQAHYAGFLQDRAALRPILQADPLLARGLLQPGQVRHQDRHHRLCGFPHHPGRVRQAATALRGSLPAYAGLRLLAWRCGW